MGADVGFVMPTPAPGVWQLPADQKPLAPWMAKMKPFMLTSADQFKAPPPPALTSPEWATEFNEIKTMGGADSTARTPEQTLIAQFFTANAGAQENQAMRKVIGDHQLNAVEAARLYAMMNMVGSDALTTCMNSKYTYLFWRPAFAVPGADTDGNDATVADPNWKPLLATPTHPEYPSNHACYTSAEAKVLASVLGTDNIDFTLSSGVTKDTLPTPALRHDQGLRGRGPQRPHLGRPPLPRLGQCRCRHRQPGGRLDPRSELPARALILPGHHAASTGRARGRPPRFV